MCTWRTTVVLLAVVLGVCLPGLAAAPQPVAAIASSHAQYSESEQAHVLAVMNTPGTRVSAAMGMVWVAGLQGRVFRIDSRSNRSSLAIRLDQGVVSVAATDRAVWAIAWHGNLLFPHCSVVRLSAATGKVVATISLSLAVPVFSPGRHKVMQVLHLGLAENIVATDRAVWVTSGRVGDQGSQAVYRIDPLTNRVVATIQVPAGGQERGSLVAVQDGVWLLTSAARGGLLSHIDERTNHVRTIRVPGTLLLPGTLAYGSGRIWAIDVAANRAIAVDTGSGRVVGALPTLRGFPEAMTVIRSVVWIATFERPPDGELYGFNAASRRQIGAPVQLAMPPSSIAATATSVWVVGPQGLERIGPL